MNTMEVTKYVAAICGSLLIFLMIGLVAHGLYSTESEVAAYSIPVEETGEGEGEGEAAETVDMAALMEAADPAAGETAFRRCASCHSVEAGENRVGPHLAGVVGRDIASVEGFGYTDVLTGLEGVWDYNSLSAFLENPRDYAPGTAMQFAGLDSAEDRANLIAWLEAQ
jgi:cytochrome c